MSSDEDSSDGENPIMDQNREILQKQGKLLCQALELLYERRKRGGETACKVWNRLVENISKIQVYFVEDDASINFWDGSTEVPPHELTFQCLLEEAEKRRREKANEQAKRATTPTTDSNDEGGDGDDLDTTIKGKMGTARSPAESSESSEESSSSGSSDSGESDSDEFSEFGPEKKLLRYFVQILEAGVETTRPSSWEWEEKDRVFKAEIELLHSAASLALKLLTMEFGSAEDFAEIEKMLDAAEENFKIVKEMNAALEAAEAGNESDNADIIRLPSGSSSTPPVAETSRDLSTCKCTGTPSRTPTKRELKVADPLNQPSTSKMWKPKVVVTNPKEPCKHKGGGAAQPHSRDWKRDGNRCICGIRFGSLTELDNHIRKYKDIRALMCAFCKYKSTRVCCLDKHITDAHADQIPKAFHTTRLPRRRYQCRYGCAEIFTSKCKMFRHQIETDRKCKRPKDSLHRTKQFPVSSTEFMKALRITLAKTDTQLTPQVLETVLEAVEKDSSRIREEKQKQAATQAGDDKQMEEVVEEEEMDETTN